MEPGRAPAISMSWACFSGVPSAPTSLPLIRHYQGFLNVKHKAGNVATGFHFDGFRLLDVRGLEK